MTRAPSPWGDTSRKHMKHRAGGTCQTCGRVLTINVDGHIRMHKVDGEVCPGSYATPLEDS